MFRNVTGEEARYATAGNALLSTRDFMRVGYLMLYEGDWNGPRIFPAAGSDGSPA